MFLGHYAVALAAKRTASRVSLGWLFFSVQLADLLWPVFLLLGLERVRIVRGAMAAYLASFFGPPPPSVKTVAYSTMVFLWLVVAWAAWADRHRATA